MIIMIKILMIDAEKCDGCGKCELECSAIKEGLSHASLSRIRIYEWDNETYLPLVCHQCENPLCETVCPVNAIYRDETLGRVVADADRCVKCRSCVSACPHGAIRFHPMTNRVMRCDLCDGDPACVKVCEPKAIQFVDCDVAESKKRYSSAMKISCGI